MAILAWNRRDSAEAERRAYERGRKEFREAVVGLLLTGRTMGGEVITSAGHAAKVIELGEADEYAAKKSCEFHMGEVLPAARSKNGRKRT